MDKKHKLQHLANSLLGKKITKHVSQMYYTISIFTSRNEFHRVVLFFIYYFSKLIREKNTNRKKNIIKINDYQMKLISTDEGISRELQVFRIHEPLVTEIIKQEIKKDMICIEIGCNIGYYALLESSLVGKNGVVIAIEPSPISFDCFKQNLLLNNISNVKPYNFAVGDTNKEIKFLVSQTSNWSRVIKESPYEGKTITLPLVKLDTFFPNLGLDHVDFIRMDIEGYEFNAYLGMTNIIKKYKPKLLIEIHYSRLGLQKSVDFLTKLKNNGYELGYLIPRGLDWAWLHNNKKDVYKLEMEQIITKIKQKSFHYDFNLFLKPITSN